MNGYESGPGSQSWVPTPLPALSPTALFSFSALMNAQWKVFVGSEMPPPKHLTTDIVSCAIIQHLCFPHQEVKPIRKIGQRALSMWMNKCMYEYKERWRGQERRKEEMGKGAGRQRFNQQILSFLHLSRPWSHYLHLTYTHTILCLMCLPLPWPTCHLVHQRKTTGPMPSMYIHATLMNELYHPTMMLPNSCPLGSRSTTCSVSSTIFVGLFGYFGTFYLPPWKNESSGSNYETHSFHKPDAIILKMGTIRMQERAESLSVVLMLWLSGCVLNYRKEEKNKENRQCNKYCKG